MEAQSKGSYAGGQHKTTLAVIVISTLSLMVITPYLIKNDDIAPTANRLTPQSQASKPVLTTTKEERGTMQQEIDSSSNKSYSQTTITVNGQQVEVPANGSYSKTTNDSSGHTEINVESSQGSNSSVTLDVRSQSSSITSE